jgi:hypothetical protein
MKAQVPFMSSSHINLSSGEIAAMFANNQDAFIGEYFDRLVLALSR